MKLSTILSTLAEAGLPSVTAEQLQQLVGTAEGKAFANDLKWYAAGDKTRQAHLAAVAYALAPDVCKTVEQLGLEFDLLALISAAKRDGAKVIEAIKTIGPKTGDRNQLLAYLRGIGLKATPSHTLAPASSVEPPYFSFKVFASSAALCISEARTRIGNHYTIQIEGALLLAGDRRKEFDWRNKIVIQLTVQEAYQTLALFENMIPRVKFDGHGRSHDKSLHIEFQESRYFAKLVQRARSPVAVPVMPVDAVRIMALLYKQLLRNDEHLRMEDLRSLIARMAALMPAHRE
jgi:hypothetical protein